MMHFPVYAFFKIYFFSGTEFLKEPTSDRGWFIGMLAVALSAVVLLLFGTVFYRKKYMKEKDPELPTLTYVSLLIKHSPIK